VQGLPFRRRSKGENRRLSPANPLSQAPRQARDSALSPRDDLLTLRNDIKGDAELEEQGSVADRETEWGTHGALGVRRLAELGGEEGAEAAEDLACDLGFGV
jgi:hypothetical protein